IAMRSNERSVSTLSMDLSLATIDKAAQVYPAMKLIGRIIDGLPLFCWLEQFKSLRNPRIGKGCVGEQGHRDEKTQNTVSVGLALSFDDLTFTPLQTLGPDGSRSHEEQGAGGATPMRFIVGPQR